MKIEKRNTNGSIAAPLAACTLAATSAEAASAYCCAASAAWRATSAAAWARSAASCGLTVAIWDSLMP
jgi:hypothetical protein